MINYLTHNEIDPGRWDDCISRSANRRVYAFSWYLDIVCPGWDALVMDDYKCIFPLPHFQKWGIHYLAQPYFAQQLGIFSPEILQPGLVSEFIRAIPGNFRFAELQLNSMNTVEAGAGEVTVRSNYELDLTPSYEKLAALYSQNTRRNIRKAKEAGIGISQSGETDALVDLFRENFGKQEGKLKDVHYNTISRLMVHCVQNNLGYVRYATTKEGLLSAGAFFLIDHTRVYFLFAASAPEARENGAMFLLIDRFIAGNAAKGLMLDFEGGNDPNLGRFYKSFGSSEVTYPALRIRRLTRLAEWGLYSMRRFRK